MQRAVKTPFGQDPAALRKLFIYMLAGNAQVVQQRASQVTLRLPAIWGKAHRLTRGMLAIGRWPYHSLVFPQHNL